MQFWCNSAQMVISNWRVVHFWEDLLLKLPCYRLWWNDGGFGKCDIWIRSDFGYSHSFRLLLLLSVLRFISESAFSSKHDLVLVSPFYSFSDNAAICCSFVMVRDCLVKRIRSLELPSVMWVTISNHDLRRVLVGHDDGWLWQLWTCCSRIVWHEGFLAHSCMLDALLLVGFSIDKCKQTVSTSLSMNDLNVVGLERGFLQLTFKIK